MTTASRPATPSENRIVKILMPNARRTRAQHFTRASHSSQALIGASNHVLLWYYFQPPCYIASRSSPVVVASIINDASGVGGCELRTWLAGEREFTMIYCDHVMHFLAVGGLSAVGPSLLLPTW